MSFYHGFDLAERQRLGCFTRIGVVRFATSKMQEWRDYMVSEYRGRAEAAADKTQLKGSDNPGASSLHTIPQVPNNPSSSTPHPGSVQTPESDSDDETEEEDWKSKGAAVLRYRPHTVPEHPYEPTAPTSNTQGSESRNQHASAASSRQSGGRGGQKKRGRDKEDMALARPIKAKKTKA
ncbi:MAG: hypothetical protein Q9175_004681 [Cornicularia normoerica]